ncbi:MAG: hypothetical protein P4M09_01465 [Devosia sp.]|nr:hypothetical protein [Devosia sp.]
MFDRVVSSELEPPRHLMNSEERAEVTCVAGRGWHTRPMCALRSRSVDQVHGSKSHLVVDRPYLLPTDLPSALKWLATEELAILAAAVGAEQRRRSPTEAEPNAVTDVPAPSPREQKQETTVPGLTKSQISAIRASFKAGVKPTTISRQFGVSQAAIRAALATAK